MINSDICDRVASKGVYCVTSAMYQPVIPSKSNEIMVQILQLPWSRFTRHFGHMGEYIEQALKEEFEYD